MIPAGKQGEHFSGFLGCVGLSQNLSFADHDGVRGDDQIVLFPGNGQRFFPAEPGHLVKGRPGRIHGFIDICRVHGERNTEEPQQFLSPG